MPPYSLAWDGGQWVVKRTIAKTKSQGEREELVGYYANLNHAIYYGIVMTGITQLGQVSLDDALKAMSDLWEAIKENAQYVEPAKPPRTYHPPIVAGGEKEAE